ncbi:MAG: NADH:flavin oxidoreductase [Planctomycetia bacterium]|nr:NADH:flavin oxidoreductase [Planctomycetia bacterium]
MAHYFRFKTLDELRQECARLKVDLVFQDDLSPLFTSVTIGNKVLGNRLCIHPMEGCDGTTDGHPGDLTERRYRRFGSGGAKLIWGEAAAVVPEARANSRQLIADVSHLTSLARLAELTRNAHLEAFGKDDDLLIGLQLTHSGRYSYQQPLIACHDELLDARLKSPARYLSDEDLKRLEDDYVTAAHVAYRAGFQFVDLKQCHRYLLNELLSARTRPGPYGGCFENRTRLARNILSRCRQELPSLILASRINLFDGIPFKRMSDNKGQAVCCTLPLSNYWGVNPSQPDMPDLNEPVQWIGEMHSLGVSLFNLTMGNPYASPHYLRPFEYPPPDGYATPEHPLEGVHRHLHLAGQVQLSYPQLPCVGSGYSWLQEFLFNAGAASIQQGKISLVGVGRASLSQPDFAKQLMDHGKLDRKRVCRTFSYCTALMRSKHNAEGQFVTGCPPFDKEVYGPVWKQAKETMPE